MRDEGVLRHLRPASMIEVGSGFSSLVSARVKREQLAGSMRFTCIEPYPRDFLLSGVEYITELLVEKVDDVDLALFEALQAGDVADRRRRFLGRVARRPLRAEHDLVAAVELQEWRRT